MKIITFYTDDPIYSKHIKNFHQSLIKINSPYDVYIEAVSCKRLLTWSSATNYKPVFIKRCLEKFNESVLWVDADAVFHGGLEIFETITESIACHFRRKRELLTGTLFFNPTDIAFQIIDQWITNINARPGIWEQLNLQKALHNFSPLEIYKLSAGYTFIYDIMRKTNEYTGPIYIEHFQASREKRRLEKNGRIN